MRAICLIALFLAGCGSDIAVTPDLGSDMAACGEFCGCATPCCTDVTQPCTNGQFCKFNMRCGGYYVCQAGSWVHMNPSCDMATSPDDLASFD
ncbi:MAG: hypothetical protein ACXVDD_11135 [Polyangia bacterium]